MTKDFRESFIVLQKSEGAWLRRRPGSVLFSVKTSTESNKKQCFRDQPFYGIKFWWYPSVLFSSFSFSVVNS